MKISCSNEIINSDLGINIDLTNTNSWDLNTNLTIRSLNSWSNAYSDNIILNDFGLTAFDNGRYDPMWSGITLIPSDVYLNLYRVGYNIVDNPSTGETSGYTTSTTYLPITGVTGGSNYFNLNGGYMQGFFKLEDYNYELFPSRYSKGITIENLLVINIDSQGIFYTMGLRAEDKYNLYFSGETTTGSTNTFTGVTTSEANYLNALMRHEQNLDAFADPLVTTETIYSATSQTQNIVNNIIAFELTENKNLGYKYIDSNGLIKQEISPNTVSSTGLTIISVVYDPYEIIDDSKLACSSTRLGDLIFYVNGRIFWKVKDFNEFYFRGVANDKEKQQGLPYSISWGGGTFGLKHSYHYDFQTYGLYDNNNTTYVNTNFTVRETPASGTTAITGLTLSADSITFDYNVMEVVNTGTTASTFYIKFNKPISVISNRDYTISLSLYDTGMFNDVNSNGDNIYNVVSILPYSENDDITYTVDDKYISPLTQLYVNENEVIGEYPFPDNNEYQYVNDDGVMYYGENGLPVYNDNGDRITYTDSETDTLVTSSLKDGLDKWHTLDCTFRIEENVGQELLYFGILIETNADINTNIPIYFKDFTYTAADILVQDSDKDNLLIEQNFDSSYIGGVQKLRIYNNALNSTQILNNAIAETNINVYRGGRIINV